MSVLFDDGLVSSSGSYQINNSIVLNGSSQYLTRTPTVAGNRKTWTFSTWVKRSKLGAPQRLFSSDNQAGTVSFGDDDTLFIQTCNDANNISYGASSSALFRDVSSWLHVVAVVDTTATSGQRVKGYVNGIQVVGSGIGTYNEPSLNDRQNINNTVLHSIGRYTAGYHYYDGYLSKTYFIDGAALTPSSFGEFDVVTGEWVPKKAVLTGRTNYSNKTTGTYTASGTNPSNAADGNIATYVAYSSGTSHWWKIQYASPQTIRRYESYCENGGAYASSIVVSGSNDDSTYTTLGTYTPPSNGSYLYINGWHGFDFTNNNAYAYYKITFNYSSANNPYINTINLYTCDDTGGVGYNGFHLNYEDATNLGFDNLGAITSKAIAQSTGTIVTNASANTSACFNGTVESSGSATYIAGQNLYVGKDFSIARAICGFKAYGSSDRGYQGDNQSHTMTLKLLGSNTNDPTTASVVYTAPSFTNISSYNMKDYSSAVSNPPSYRYWWVQVRDENWTSGYTTTLADLEFYELTGNNFTPINLTSAAQTIDTPTNNFATFNPLKAASTFAFSNGNRTATTTGYWAATTFELPKTGKWYWEVDLSNSSHELGVAEVALRSFSGGLSNSSGGYAFGVAADGTKFTNASYTAYAGGPIGSPYKAALAYDADNGGELYIRFNGTWVAGSDPTTRTNPAFTGLNAYNLSPAVGNSSGSSTTLQLKAVEAAFSYAPPTGFKALCTTNLPTPSIKDGDKHFDVVTYTGNGSTQTITGLDFQPDFVWIKGRSSAYSHNLFDRVRGVEKVLSSNSTSAENFYLSNPGDLTSFNSDGFTIRQTTNYELSHSGDTYVAWCWKAGGTAVTNTNGTITSQVSANPTAGFSIVSYTGNGTTGATVGHGLGASPSFVILKARNPGGNDWWVYHKSLGATDAIALNTTAAKTTSSGAWNNTNPTSSVFTLGSWGAVNLNTQTMIGYCWSEIEGFSKFGSYTGNGSTDGPFVYCGFKPRYILIKDYVNGDSSGGWWMYDTKRNEFNVVKNPLRAESSATEATDINIDVVSNGFKIRNDHSGINSGSRSYIYAAFADVPFKYANAR